MRTHPMNPLSTLRAGPALLAICSLLCLAGGARASIFPIIPDDGGGARFTFLHANGDDALNRKFMSGTLSGDLGTGPEDAFIGTYDSGASVLTITGGSMTGASGSFGSTFFGAPSTNVFVEFTAGKLKFFGGATNEVGGWIDYNIYNDSDGTSSLFDSGTLFFEAANLLGPTISPNTGTAADGFRLWGNNFAYSDTKDADGWDFLTDLMYWDTHTVLPTRSGSTDAEDVLLATNVVHNLGTDIRTGEVPGGGLNPVPELSSGTTWTLLLTVGAVVWVYSRRQRVLC